MGYGYLSCRALHSKIINKRRLMLKTNDVRISDCSLLLHASLKCVCSGNGPLLFRRPPFGPAAAFLLHFLFILLCSRCRRARAVYLHRVKVVLVVEVLLRLLSVSLNCRPNSQILSARFPQLIRP